MKVNKILSVIALTVLLFVAMELGVNAVNSPAQAQVYYQITVMVWDVQQEVWQYFGGVEVSLDCTTGFFTDFTNQTAGSAYFQPPDFWDPWVAICTPPNQFFEVYADPFMEEFGQWEVVLPFGVTSFTFWLLPLNGL